MKTNLNPKVRFAIYVLTGVGTPAIAYLFAKGIIGELEVTLLSAWVTFASTLAALNVKEK